VESPQLACAPADYSQFHSNQDNKHWRYQPFLLQLPEQRRHAK